MGSARKALESSPFHEQLERQRVKESLENDVRRTRQQRNSEAYVKALIRFNEFLIQELSRER